MKKLLYVSFEESENRASGVNKKINAQMKVFEDEGFSTDLLARYQDKIALYHGGQDPMIYKAKMPWRISLCDWVAKHAKDYNYAYIRFQFFCPFVLNMLHSLHKAAVKIIMEIPTYPYVPELKKQGLRGIPKRIIDATFRNACAANIDCFAAPLYENDILKKKCLEIRNGIEVNEIKERKGRSENGTIHLLAVAMMAPWHGYDRMNEGLNRYYSSGGERDLILHLVGQGAASAGYNDLVSRYGLSDHVVQHGKLHGIELEKMYDITDIGVGSLGIHRTGVQKTNTLKILEYMAKGMPVICEHSECGIPTDSPYRMTVSDDDSAIPILEVIKFYEDVYQHRDTKQVIEEIRKECSASCNVKSGMEPVLNFFEASD